jgi:hypothetical protein
MNALDIYNALKEHRGQHIKVVWERPAKTFKSCPHTITKHTSVFVRSGINYANLKNVKNGISSGTRDEVGELPFGQWREGYFPYLIDNKGISYVRLYPATFDNLKPNSVNVTWTINGMTTEKEAIKDFLLASETKDNAEPSPCFTVKAENVISVG